MKYHALFVIFKKSSKILNCRLLQLIGGALWVNLKIQTVDPLIWTMEDRRLVVFNQTEEFICIQKVN